MKVTNSRELALIWWQHLGFSEKKSITNLFGFANRNENSLTGREIECLYNKALILKGGEDFLMKSYTVKKINKNMNSLSKAIAITSAAFVGGNDKGGQPYILHCLYVMDKVKHLGNEVMCAAVMHDLIEDTDCTFDELRQEGFTQEVITILELLTHRKETDYMDYIKAISVHPSATAIKLADLEHNSKITRLKGLRKKDFDRLEKYIKAYTYLKN